MSSILLQGQLLKSRFYVDMTYTGVDYPRLHILAET